MAERVLVKTLSEIKDKKSYATRHTPDLKFDLVPETRFFNVDGAVNVDAVLSKGITKIEYFKKEAELHSEVLKEIKGTENEWGLSAELKSEELNKVDHQKSSSTRNVHHRNDVPRDDEAVHKALEVYSVNDDRQARLERLQKFEEIAPKIANYNKALSIEPILLDGDTVISSFKCSEIKGIPSSWYGMNSGKWLSFTTVDDSGLIQISLIQNREKKYRFHISICNAQTKFSADEVFYDKLESSAVTCCFCPSVRSEDLQRVSISYDQLATFSSRDLLIPLYDKGFQNCVTYRKQSQRTIVTANGNSSQQNDGIVDCDKFMNSTCCLCIFSHLDYWNITPYVSGTQDNAFVKSTSLCFNESAYCCFTCGYNTFIALPSGRFPCVLSKTTTENSTEYTTDNAASRLMYFCCAARCYYDCCYTLCGIDNASVLSERKIQYSAEETYSLGEDNSIKKVFSKLPVKPKQKNINTGEWKAFPWYSCGCCFMEYKGEFNCLYCLGLTKIRSNKPHEKCEWEYVQPKKDNFNDVFVELNFQDALQRSRIAMSQAGTSIHSIARPLASSYSYSNRLVLKLATTFEDVDVIHENARKFVSFVGNNCNDMYQQLDEALALEKFRQDAVVKTIDNTNHKTFGIVTPSIGSISTAAN